VVPAGFRPGRLLATVWGEEPEPRV
jgi:hypothetical protein